MFNLTLDPESAKAGSGTGYQGIQTSGLHDGKFTQVIAHTWASTAAGMRFTFEAKSGAETIFDINLKKKDGNPNTVGINQVQAMMAVLRIKQLSYVDTRIMLMNWDANPAREEMMPVQAYPDLCAKPIGIVLQSEEYMRTAGNNAGHVGTRMNFVASCEADSKKTAQELYASAEAQQIDAILEHLVDIKLENYPNSTKHSTAAYQPPLPGSNGFDQNPTSKATSAGGSGGGSTNFDDDIPFDKIRGVV